MTDLINHQLSEPIRVLFIDDDELNHIHLEVALRPEGWRIITAATGAEGLRKAVAAVPSLILLDIIMPDMDGFEVFQQLRQNVQVQNIPVIFVSGTEESCDKVKALEVGAADFISKPFDPAELRVRIKNQVRLKRFEEINKRYLDQLEEMVEQRTQQLISSERLAQLGTLAAGIAHEVNNPNAFIRGNIQVFERFWEKIEVVLKVHGAAGEQADEDIAFILEEVPKLIASIEKGTSRITKIVHGLKSFAYQRECERETVDVNKCVEESLELARNLMKYRIELECDQDDALATVTADQQQLVQVILNLLTNAADALEGVAHPKVRVVTRGEGNKVLIEVIDNGSGIDPQAMNRIWNPFYTTKPPGKGTGLGLSISQSIVEKHGGTITAYSHQEHGTRMTVALPAFEVPAPVDRNSERVVS